MASKQQEETKDAAPVGTEHTDPVALQTILTNYLKNLPPDQLAGILSAAGAVPTTMGMTPEHLQVLMGTMSKVSADAQKEAIRSQRVENPLYPERSVFNPRGRYTDDGTALEPKVKFRIPTFLNNVRLGGELETEEEIALFNRFTESRYAREGMWKAEIEGLGNKQRLKVTIPSLTPDDRNMLAPLPMMLRELLDGKEAVNTESLHKKIEAMEAEIAALKTNRLPQEAVV